MILLLPRLQIGRVFTIRPLMSSTPVQVRLASYDEAIKNLNSLQTNSAQLRQVIKERQKNVHLNLPRTSAFLAKLGITDDDLNSLNVIHVSGTKGKGSTCAFLESILRRKGYKTGFYSSPHLVTVTERIRLNGVPISQEKFSQYCLKAFAQLCQPLPQAERPPYFQFLTILAYQIFHQEDIDVAIIEVGIGGEYDNTNVIKKPVLCGITSLGLDHVSILGNTIEEIAWHKAGIMKPGVPVFVDNEQPPNAVTVLKQRAKEIGANLFTVPEFDDYMWKNFPLKSIALNGRVQEKNASLALQLARSFDLIKKTDMQKVECAPFELNVTEALGLRLTSWPGRSQVVAMRDVTFYLDGAHTVDSVQACADWYKSIKKSENDKQVLIFNVTRDRKPNDMLEILRPLDFDLVIFCSTTSRRAEESDNTNHNTNVSSQVQRCGDHLKLWNDRQRSVVIPYINDALGWLTQYREVPLLSHYQGIDLQLEKYEIEVPEFCKDRGIQMNVLVTGSLHLVGGVLEQIQPNVCYKTKHDIISEDEIILQYENLLNGCSSKEVSNM